MGHLRVVEPPVIARLALGFRFLLLFHDQRRHKRRIALRKLRKSVQGLREERTARNTAPWRPEQPSPSGVMHQRERAEAAAASALSLLGARRLRCADPADAPGSGGSCAVGRKTRTIWGVVPQPDNGPERLQAERLAPGAPKGCRQASIKNYSHCMPSRRRIRMRSCGTGRSGMAGSSSP